MATLYKSVDLSPASHAGGPKYVEPDTKIPPKAGPVLPEVSVNGVVIPEPEIMAEAQHHPAKNPGSALREAAQALVVKELLLQEAKSRGCEGDSQADAAGKKEAEDDAAIRLLVESEVDVPVAQERECRRYYDNNKQRFRSQTIFEARHILLPAPAIDESKRPKARQLAETLITEVTSDPSKFASLAQEFSACPSNAQGGSLGQITKGDTVTEFEDVLEDMGEGELRTTPVETPFGFHVVMLERKIPGAVLPFEHVCERISAWLQAASWSRAVSQYVGILAGQADIKGVDLPGSDSPLVQ
ncbi:MAG: peptidylprolyl isomerase [Rhizobiaceae bacterium]